MMRPFFRANKNQKQSLANAIFELANIIAGALVFGQFVSDEKLSLRLLAFGIITTSIFYLWAYRLSKINGLE